MGDLAGINSVHVPRSCRRSTAHDSVFTDAAPSTFDGVGQTHIESTTNLVATKSAIAAMLARRHGHSSRSRRRTVSRAHGRATTYCRPKARQRHSTPSPVIGFAMPPGMLVALVNTITGKTDSKSADNNRDILAKSAQWEIKTSAPPCRAASRWRHR